MHNTRTWIWNGTGWARPSALTHYTLQRSRSYAHTKRILNIFYFGDFLPLDPIGTPTRLVQDHWHGLNNAEASRHAGVRLDETVRNRLGGADLTLRSRDLDRDIDLYGPNLRTSL